MTTKGGIAIWEYWGWGARAHKISHCCKILEKFHHKCNHHLTKKFAKFPKIVCQQRTVETLSTRPFRVSSWHKSATIHCCTNVHKICGTHLNSISTISTFLCSLFLFLCALELEYDSVHVYAADFCPVAPVFGLAWLPGFSQYRSHRWSQYWRLSLFHLKSLGWV
jgi:hypothetical protein